MTALIPDRLIRAHVDMATCIESVEAAFGATASDRFAVSERKVVEVTDGARLLSLTAASDRLGRLVANVYSGAPTGASKTGSSVNRRQKLYLLFSASTGECEAIIGGATLSRLKTGAMGGVAIRYLSSPDADRLAILGSGRQARVALEGALAVRRFSQITVWSPTVSHAQRFADEAPVPVVVTDSAETAVREAEVIVTATTSPTPIVEAAWLAPGAHVNSIGAHYPTHRELDAATIAGADVIVDSMVTARAEKGELLLAAEEGRFSFDDIVAELGEVVSGKTDWIRHPDRRTIFASCGSAVESLGAALGALAAVPTDEVIEFEF